MRRQRNVAQVKEQIITPEKKLKEIEISNLSDAGFKALVIRMLKELSEDLNSIKELHSEMKDTLKWRTIYRETTVERKTENQINDLEHKEEKTTNQNNKQKKRIQNNEDSINSSGTNLRGPTFTSQG